MAWEWVWEWIVKYTLGLVPAIFTAGLLVGLLIVGPISKHPVRTFKRYILVSGLLLIIGSVFGAPYPYVLIFAALVYIGLLGLGIAFGHLFYHLLWLEEEVREVKATLQSLKQ